jgi:D-aspartate ligase
MENFQKNSPDKPCGAVVLASSYTALGIVRSLGRNGIPVWILDDKNAPTGLSRYVKRSFPLVENETEQLALLIEIAKKYDLRGWALFPDSDKGSALIAKHHQELSEYYQLTIPPWPILQWAVDKSLTYQVAAETGVDYPKTFYPKSRVDVEKLEGQFPVILKPASHQGHDAFSNIRAWQANNKDELLALYDTIYGLVDSSVIMIQEMIPGGLDTEFSYAALCKDGKVLADAMAERKRLMPLDFGVGVYLETIEKKEIEAPAKRWLEKINYTGLVEIDFKFDKQDGRYKILDVNARAWGWIAMCAYAGVDFPYLMWKLSQGESISPAHARSGVRWIRTVSDLDSAIQSMRNGSLTLGEYLASLKGVKHQMYVWDDLKPALADFSRFARRVFRNLKRVLFGK